MHLIPRHATENAGTVPPHSGDTASLSDISGQPRRIIVAQETHVLPVFDSVGYNQSVYTLWPLVSLLRVSSWMQTKPNFLRFGILRASRFAQGPQARHRFDARALASGRKAFEREQRKFLRFKRMCSQDDALSQKRPTNAESSSALGPRSKSVPLFVSRTIKSNPSLMIREQTRRDLRCYASIAYGTKICKWVRLQQQTKKCFYDRMYTKIGIVDAELEFYQLVLQRYL